MKKFKLLAIIVLGLLFITACKNTQEDAYVEMTTEADRQGGVTDDVYETTQEVEVQAIDNEDVIYPLTISDKFTESIIIEQEPQKVISFSPELVEIMYEIGAEDKLIGRSQYCDYPEQAAEVADMGDLFNLNIETIVEAEPDLVLLSSMAGEDVVNSLKDQGITVITLDADTDVDGVFTYIQALGNIFNRKNQADQLTQKMQNEIKKVTDLIEGLDKPTAYFVVGIGEYDSAATGDTFIGELMELAGSENAAADGTDWMYSVEQLVEKDPDILVCSMYWDTKKAIMAEEGYKDLTAVKEDRLYEIDENIFYRQGPRMVEAIQVLAEIFHPEAF